MCHSFCRERLKHSREVAKIKKVKIPKMKTQKETSYGDGYYVEFGEKVDGDWSKWFQSCCSYEAKAQAIQGMLKERILI